MHFVALMSRLTINEAKGFSMQMKTGSAIYKRKNKVLQRATETALASLKEQNRQEMSSSIVTSKALL